MAYKVIQDGVGRTIIGTLVSENEQKLTLNNPVILHVQPDQQGRLQVQSFPLFFMEFISKDAREKNEWTYSKSNIVIGDVELDATIVQQYEKINTPQPTFANPANVNPKVVSITDL